MTSACCLRTSSIKADILLSERNNLMSKKVVVVHCDHVFCGYHSDYDYDGNAIFGDFLISAFYVSPKKARKLLADQARKKGLTVVGDGSVAVGKPKDTRYESEHEYMTIYSPANFLFEFGVLREDQVQAEAAIGDISVKDRRKYEAIIADLADSYDPY